MKKQYISDTLTEVKGIKGTIRAVFVPPSIKKALCYFWTEEAALQQGTSVGLDKTI